MILTFNDFYNDFFKQEDFHADVAGVLLSLKNGTEDDRAEFMSWLEMGITIEDVAYGFDIIPMTITFDLDQEEMENFWLNSEDYQDYQKNIA